MEKGGAAQKIISRASCQVTHDRMVALSSGDEALMSHPPKNKERKMKILLGTLQENPPSMRVSKKTFRGANDQ